MRVIPFEPQYKPDFIEMNEAWISEMFRLEPEDQRLLNEVESEIARGAQIFFAIDEETSRAASCCMVAPFNDHEWEIEKFATRKEFARRGAGTAVLLACIEYAKRKGCKKLLIVSNTKCEQALRLYRKTGFKEIPVDKERFPFERGNISFQMDMSEFER